MRNKGIIILTTPMTEESNWTSQRRRSSAAFRMICLVSQRPSFFAISDRSIYLLWARKKRVFFSFLWHLRSDISGRGTETHHFGGNNFIFLFERSFRWNFPPMFWAPKLSWVGSVPFFMYPYYFGCVNAFYFRKY